MDKLEDTVKKRKFIQYEWNRNNDKKPISIDKDALAVKALSLMNEKNNFTLCS